MTASFWNWFYAIPSWVWWLIGLIVIAKWLSNIRETKLDLINGQLEIISRTLGEIGKSLDKLGDEDMVDKAYWKLADISTKLEMLEQLDKLNYLERLEELNDKLVELEKHSKKLLDEFDWRAKDELGFQNTFGRRVIDMLDRIWGETHHKN